MKDGWKIVKLGKCFSSINNGANIKQIKGAQGFPITRIETLSNDKFNRDRMGYADIYDYSKYSNYILNDGDILMSHINSMKFLGRSVLYNKINNETIIHGMNLLRLVPITNLILCSYVNYYFSTKSFKEQIQGISHQSVNQASFNVTSLKNLDVILPPLEEQHRIVSILDASFEKIDALKKNAEENLKNTKALFQQVLAQELKPKEGWVEKKLGEVSKEIFAGGDAPKQNMSKTITEQYPIPIYANAVEEDGLYGFTDKARVNEPAITIAARGSGTGHVLRRKVPFLPIVRLIVIIPNPLIEMDYMYYALKSINIRKAGAAIPQLTVPMLREYKIPFPTDIEQQRKIVRILDALSEKCRRLEQVAQQTICECDALKQSILRQAFSGEL